MLFEVVGWIAAATAALGLLFVCAWIWWVIAYSVVEIFRGALAEIARRVESRDKT